MESNNSIEQILDNLTPNKIVKKKKTILKPVIYLVVGILFFIINSSIEYHSGEIVYPLLLIFGTAFIIIGITAFLSRKLHYYDAETGKLLKRKEIYFDIKEQARLVKYVEERKMDEIFSINKSVIHGLKLCIYATTDFKWCFMQVFRYEENQFKTVSNAVQLSTNEAQMLSLLCENK